MPEDLYRAVELGAAKRSPVGRVIAVTGSQAGIGILPDDGRLPRLLATVGRFVGLRADQSFIVAMVTEATADLPPGVRAEGFSASITVDLVGEIRPDTDGHCRFRRGVSTYPAIGDDALPLEADDLRLVYATDDLHVAVVGTLHQDRSLPACIDVDGLVSKHFAVLGTTGVGKSSAMAIMLGEIIEARPDLRVFLLDGHNEYGRCFGERANVINSRTVKLPFWLFNFEELTDVIYGGRPAVAEEIEILLEVIPIAKSLYSQYKTGDRALRRKGDVKASGYTIDTPVPYTVQDLLAQIDERMGRLENRGSRMHFHRLMTRIETIRNDPHYAFMFENANVGGDTMADLLTNLFRLDPGGKPISVMQMAGLPPETLDAVVCVLCRLAFDFGLWSEGAVPLLFVCEEAHRYASSDASAGFHPTRRALTRIAREGRKYGVSLGLVTQRPAEIDPTIIAQCGTLFAMRMANDRDQALLRSAVSDAAANLLSFVPTLATGEAVAFGEGVSVPVRLSFRQIPADLLPRNEAAQALGQANLDPQHCDFVKTVVDRWRGASMSGKPRQDDPEIESEGAAELRLLRSRLETNLFRTPPSPAG
ncbi:MAG: ATP-binding protein [Janthinobacterium lividum]